MAVHPEIQQKCYKEIVQVMGDETVVTPDHVEKLEFLDMCLREMWRIFSIPIIIDRQTDYDTKLGKYIIPANTAIFIDLFGMQRNPKYFPDPMKFDPERWRKDPNKEIKSPIYSFGGGVRVCIGKTFARAEIVCLICALMRNFKFENWNSNITWPIPVKLGFTLQPKNPIIFNVTRRN